MTGDDLPDERLAQLRTDALRIIAETATLPLKDAAYALWRQKWRIDDGLSPPLTPAQRAEAMSRSMEEIARRIRDERDHAQDGPTFDRLKQVHPRANDSELKAAIVAAVRFEDDLSANYSWERFGFAESIDRAVAAARRKNPGYLEGTYRDAKSWLIFVMK